MVTVYEGFTEQDATFSVKLQEKAHNVTTYELL